MAWVVVAAVAAVSSTAYGIYSGEEAKKATRSKEDDDNKERSRLQLEAKNAETISEETAKQQKARARQKVMGASLPAPTLLGGGMAAPLGGTLGSTPSASKTLLGQ